MRGLWQDLRCGVRLLTKSPAFAATAVLTLALGIGASTAVFSVADAVLLRPLPYPHPQQIVRIWEQAADGHRMNVAISNLDDFRTQNDTFASVAGYEETLASVYGASDPARVNIAVVSDNFFRTLGIEPFRGHVFTGDEQRPHGAAAVIVSYGYWQRYLGGTADLSRFRLNIERRSYPVIGVMPAGFNFPPATAAWISSEIDPGEPTRTAHNWRCIGRVQDGVTVGQARANLRAIAQRIQQLYGKKVDLSDVAVVPLADAMVGDVRTALLTLLGAVGILLLVAFANVAGLLLARNASRSRELAVRGALGAGRMRLIQQFLVESLVLSLAGGALGILLASWGVHALPAILPTNLPRQEGIAINLPVLLFALVATMLVTVSLGLVTASHAGGGDLQKTLSAGGRYEGGSLRVRSLLVTGEIATTLVILVGAGLLGHSFLRLISTSPGFRQDHLITMEFSPSISLSQIRQLDDILARLRVIPGAEDVGLAGAVPAAHGDDLSDGTFLVLNGQKPPANFDEWQRIAQSPSNVGHADYCVASEGYFRTLGIPLIRGRIFGVQDDVYSPHVAVISESLARRRWPNQNPIGQVIEFGNMDGILKPLTVVGVVGDIRAAGLNLPPPSIIYVDYRQRGMTANSSPTILLRSHDPVGKIVPEARGIFQEVAPEVPVKFSTFAQEMGGWLADRRFLLLIIGLFAGSALTLAAVGIYGAVAVSVTRRTREIGVRMALGAQRGDVLRLVLGEAARMAALGVTVGIAASLGITRLISSLLFGVSTTDPLTFVAVAAGLFSVAMFASYIPARRATRVDPVVALRYE